MGIDDFIKEQDDKHEGQTEVVAKAPATPQNVPAPAPAIPHAGIRNTESLPPLLTFFIDLMANADPI